MKKFACVLAMVVAAGVTASVPVLRADEAQTQPSTQQAAKDSGNTKCLLMPEDDVTEGMTADYKGVTYHFCCKACVKAFKKNPEKYVKALEENPDKYGVKK